VDLTVASGSTSSTIDQTAFPGTPAESFWTSSPYAGSSGYAWRINFFYGVSNDDDVGISYRVRCVR
jgi:hypothetical protein